MSSTLKDKSSSESGGGVQRSTSRLSTVEVQEATESIDNSRNGLREEEENDSGHVDDQDEPDKIEEINKDQNVKNENGKRVAEECQTNNERYALIIILDPPDSVLIRYKSYSSNLMHGNLRKNDHILAMTARSI